MSSTTAGPEARRRLATVGVVLAAMLVGAALLAVVTRSWDPPVQDLRVYRDGAARVLDGLSLYPPGSRYAPDQPLPFTYPPFAALAFVPLAVLSVASATAVWWLLSAVALGWLLARSFAPALDRLPLVGRWAAGALLAALMVIALAPVFRVLAFGQIGLVLAALCLVDLDLATRGSRRAGVLVGVATAVKLTPAAFALTFLASGRRRAVVLAATTCLLAWLVAAVLLPADTRAWLGLVGDSERIGPVAGAVNTSWHGLWLRLLGDSALTTVVWVTCAVATLAVGGVRSGRLLRTGHALTAATVIGLAAVLASPVSWVHHAVWVVPLLGIVLDDARSWRRWAVAAGIFAVFSEAGTAWQDLTPGTPELTGVLDWFWVNTCVLVMALVVVLLRPGPGTRTSPLPAPVAEGGSTSKGRTPRLSLG